MEELDRLPEWAGRKAETQVSKETWSAAELNQPLISLDTEEHSDAPPEPILTQNVVSEPASVATIDPEPPHQGRWLLILAALSLIAGIAAGVLYMAVFS